MRFYPRPPSAYLLVKAGAPIGEPGNVVPIEQGHLIAARRFSDRPCECPLCLLERDEYAETDDA